MKRSDVKRHHVTSAQKVYLALFGILIALVIAEIVCRISYTDPWYVRLVEEQRDTDEGRAGTRNSLGLRGPDHATARGPEVKRVLVLGDSFTFGAGVADDAAVFPARLERSLSVELAEVGERVEILNGGIPGSLTHQWVNLLDRVKDTFKPDVILIVFFLRDGTTTGSIPSFFDPIRKEIQERDENSFWFEHMYLFRLYAEYRDRARLAERYSRRLKESYFGDQEQTREWRNAQANIGRILETAERVGATVGLVVFPILVELNPDYPFTDICRTIVQFGVESRIEVLDLLPAFMGHEGHDLWVSSYNQHPNARGHEIAARAISPFLRQMLADVDASDGDALPIEGSE